MKHKMSSNSWFIELYFLCFRGLLLFFIFFKGHCAMVVWLWLNRVSCDSAINRVSAELNTLGGVGLAHLSYDCSPPHTIHTSIMTIEQIVINSHFPLIGFLLIIWYIYNKWLHQTIKGIASRFLGAGSFKSLDLTDDSSILSRIDQVKQSK